MTASVTIKSRPRADGSVSWFLYFRPALPDGTTLMPVPGYSRPEDRPHVEAFAEPYRVALRRGLSKPKPETCDEWRDRADVFDRECGKTDPTKRKRWNKWISKRIGSKTPSDVRAPTSKTFATSSTPRSPHGRATAPAKDVSAGRPR